MLVVPLAPITFCLLSFRPHDYSSEGFNDWAFMTTHSWDEDPQGKWTLEIENVVGTSDYGNSILISSPSSCFFFFIQSLMHAENGADVLAEARSLAS